MVRILAMAFLLVSALLVAPSTQAADVDASASLCQPITPTCDDPNPGGCRTVGYDCISQFGWCDYYVAGVCVNA